MRYHPYACCPPPCPPVPPPVAQKHVLEDGTNTNVEEESSPWVERVKVNLNNDIDLRSVKLSTSIARETNHPDSAVNIDVYGEDPPADLPIGTRLVQNGAVYRLVRLDGDDNPVPTLLYSNLSFNTQRVLVQAYDGSLLNGTITVLLSAVQQAPELTVNDPRFLDGSIMTSNGTAYMRVIAGLSFSGPNAVFSVKMGITGTLGVGTRVDILASPYLVGGDRQITTSIPVGVLVRARDQHELGWVVTRGPAVLIARANIPTRGIPLMPMISTDHIDGGGVQPALIEAGLVPVFVLGHSLTNNITAGGFVSVFLTLE